MFKRFDTAGEYALKNGISVCDCIVYIDDKETKL